VIFLGDFSFVIIFLKNYRVTMTTTLNTFGKYNGFVSKARVSAYMYFLVTHETRSAEKNMKKIGFGHIYMTSNFGHLGFKNQLTSALCMYVLLKTSLFTIG
jgi:hypothetical protein